MAGFNMPNFFGGNKPQAPQQPQQPQQQQQQPQNQQQRAQPPSVQQQQGPANSNFQNNGAPSGGEGNPAPQNPLDQFQQFFGGQQPPAQGGANSPQGMQVPQQMMQGNQQPGQPSYDGYLQPWDDAGIRQRVAPVKFSQSIPQEIKDRIKAGDTDAMFDAIDHVGREAFLHSTRTSHQFVDQGVKRGLEKFDTGLDDRFRNYEVSRQNPENELLRHPTVAPMFNAMKELFAKQNPNMSPQEVTAKVTEYFSTLSSAMSSDSQARNTQNSGPKETNWEESFGAASDNGGTFTPQGF